MIRKQDQASVEPASHNNHLEKGIPALSYGIIYYSPERSSISIRKHLLDPFIWASWSDPVIYNGQFTSFQWAVINGYLETGLFPTAAIELESIESVAYRLYP